MRERRDTKQTAMKTTALKMLSDFRSLVINKDEIEYCRSNFNKVFNLRPKGSVVTFYGSLQIMDGLFILN